MRCRAVTWNIHSGVGRDGVYDPSRAAEVLAEIDADVIGLQEVDWRHAPIGGRDQLEIIGDRLGLTGIAGPNLKDHRGAYGNALLTRFVVRESRQVELLHKRREPRGAIDATLVHGALSLRVLVTHLGLKRRERRRQLEAIRATLGESPPADSMLLLGDLNEWLHPHLARNPFLPELFPSSAAGRTFPSRLPWLMLDRILIAPEPVSLRHWVVDTRAARAASDHLPLVAEIEW